MKKLTNNAFIGNTGHFDNETDSAGSEGLEDIGVDHIKPLCRPQADKSDVYLLPKHIDAGSWYSHHQLCAHVACGRVVVTTRCQFHMSEMVTGVRVSSHGSPCASWAPPLFGGFVREVPLAFPAPHHYDLNQMLVNFAFWLWGPVSAYLLPEQLDEQVPTLPALTTRNMGNAMAYKLVSLPH